MSESPMVVLKCANQAEADAAVAYLAEAGIESTFIVEKPSQVLKITVAVDDLDAALNRLADFSGAPVQQNRGHVGSKPVEWTGRCPACGSLKVAEIEHGAAATAGIVLLALSAVAYNGARGIHLRHPVLDTLAIAPLMLVASYTVFRKTPNARCESCNTYWKALR